MTLKLCRHRIRRSRPHPGYNEPQISAVSSNRIPARVVVTTAQKTTPLKKAEQAGASVCARCPTRARRRAQARLRLGRWSRLRCRIMLDGRPSRPNEIPASWKPTASAAATLIIGARDTASAHIRRCTNTIGRWASLAMANIPETSWNRLLTPACGSRAGQPRAGFSFRGRE